jgi:hypothetical protein
MKMMNKLIVTDCDGVLLSWETAFHEWMTHCGYDIKKEGPKLTYHFDDTFDITREKGRELVREGVKALVNEGYVFDVVTSLGKYCPAVALREMNLERVFGKECFREIVCLGLGEDKYDYLEFRYGTESNLFWIEDKPANAEDGAELGMKSILIEHLHNKEYQSKNFIRRAKNWKDLVEIVLTDA